MQHLEQENERPPSPEELAEVLDMSEEDIKESMKKLWASPFYGRTIGRR